MNKLKFESLNLSEPITKAINEMGFEYATEIQFKSMPIALQGLDVIGKSQTGTGKTVAFGIPAIESVDPSVRGAQVLILCPTRELATQACDELRKLSKFKNGIKAVPVYGGAPIDRQIAQLKSANVVVGTPGRIMDHMNRRTLKLSAIKMVILDEADEMLSMGFRDDIETILTETPEDRQTILFSATMPPEIMALTKKYQKNPQMVEVNRKQVTVSNIEQIYYNVPMGRKMDALNLILRYYRPKLSMVFCNTKKLVDEITEYLHKNGFSVQGLHGDMKQSQRTKVMDRFKSGKTNILIATDVAARGIDVNNIDFVFNYDIPQNTEYYIHRIGRTGRAGKFGKAITICSGRHQAEIMTRLAKLVKANIIAKEMPSIDDIKAQIYNCEKSEIKNWLNNNFDASYSNMISELVSEGYSLENIATCALSLYFSKNKFEISEVKSLKERKNTFNNDNFKKIVINIGRTKRVAPNHIVGAITESTSLSGKDIGKIEIFDNSTVVSVPEKKLDSTIQMMKNCKICGVATTTKVYKAKSPFESSSKKNSGNSRFNRNLRKRKFSKN